MNCIACHFGASFGDHEDVKAAQLAASWLMALGAFPLGCVLLLLQEYVRQFTSLLQPDNFLQEVSDGSHHVEVLRAH